MYSYNWKLDRVVLNTWQAAAMLSWLFGASTMANATTLTFSGECSVSFHGQPVVVVDSFYFEANENDCPNKSIEFSVPGVDGATAYAVYVEFQRSEFGAGLRDKAYFGLEEKSVGGIGGQAKAFNVKPGAVLIFDQELKHGAHLNCTGKIN